LLEVVRPSEGLRSLSAVQLYQSVKEM